MSITFKHTLSESIQFIESEVDRVWLMACERFPRLSQVKAKPSIGYFDKGRAAGWAKYGPNRVEFNTSIARQSLPMIANTVSHELAHIIAFALFQDSGHGRHWKAVHKALGGNGERCFDAAKEDVVVVRARRTMQFQYKTSTGHILNVSKTIHNRIMAGQNRIWTVTKERITSANYTGKTQLIG